MSQQTAHLVASNSQVGQGKMDHAKTKIVSDIKVREDDRITREKEIMASLEAAPKQKIILESPSLSKFVSKFVRKMLLLTLHDQDSQKVQKQNFLVARLPSYMHLAQIMEEKTDIEKDTFGKVLISEIQPAGEKAAPGSEDIVSNLIKVFMEQHQDPKELLAQCIARSRDRFSREYSKLNAFFVNQKFFSDEGLKERQIGLKFKLLLKERYPDTMKTEKDHKNLSLHDRALSILILHNTKVNRIQGKYREEMKLKQEAREQGISYKEIRAKQKNDVKVFVPKGKPPAGFGDAEDFDVVIKMKNEEGKVQEFTHDDARNEE